MISAAKAELKEQVKNQTARYNTTHAFLYMFVLSVVKSSPTFEQCNTTLPGIERCDINKTEFLRPRPRPK